MSTYKIHLLTVDHKAVGCGWQPSALKAQDLNPIDHQSDPGSYQECVRSFKLYDFSSDWPVKQTAQEEDSEISSSSADSLTDDSVDTASESEKVTPSDLKTSIPNDPSERLYPLEEGGCCGATRQENPAKPRSLSDGPLRIGWRLGPPDRDHFGLDPELFWSHLTPANRPELHKLAPKHRRKKYCCFCCFGCCLSVSFRRTFLVTC